MGPRPPTVAERDSFRCSRILSLVSEVRSANSILFITELSRHGDEGMRNWIKIADRALADRGHRTDVLRLEGDPRWSALRPGVLRAIRRAASDILIYVPYSGLTSKALLRHIALRAAAGPRLDVLVVLQSDPVVRRPPRALLPTLGAFASERLRSAYGDAVRESCALPPVVDSTRFRPSDGARSTIRVELDLPNDRPLALHVGHLRDSRGLGPLAELAADGAMNVVVIASTATEPERHVETLLREAGVVVKREFLPQIERWYQAADVYLFPVVDLQGSIEIPLTVLEAMACGTPVATTPFGGLPSLFASTKSLRFAPADRLARTAKGMSDVDGLPNRSEVEPMNIEAFAAALEGIIDQGAPR
jgi:glycosyltransferase involved in cell wall biosynthesis